MALLGAAIMAMGYLGDGNAVSDLGFGIFSANLLSPVRPQLSGLIPGALPRMVDSTGGQYEGFVYLGAGLLFLALFSYAALRNSFLPRARRHPCLLAVMLSFTALAVSNRVYFGAYHVVTIPMPDALLELAGTVRASGRFAWPGLYAFAALAVASAARRSHAAGPLLLLAAGLQWADAEPLRRMVGVSVSSPSKGVLDTAAWRLALQKVDLVLVDPPFACLPDAPDREWQAEAAIQIQLMAAQAGAATNTLYASRTKPNCDQPPLTARGLLVRLNPAGAIPALPCQSDEQMTVCSPALTSEDLGALLGHAMRWARRTGAISGSDG